MPRTRPTATVRTDLANALVDRLRIRRGTAEGDVYVLDLRHRRFGNRAPRILRDPSDPAWPAKGRPTSDLATAKRWVRDHYAPQLAQELDALRTAPDAGALTVRAACEHYVAHRMAILGPSALPVLGSRISMLRRHVIPRFGPVPLAALTKPMVRAAVESLTVTKPGRRPGQRVTAPAELGTKRNFLRALMALWHYALPDVACPFAGVRLVDEGGLAARRRVIDTGDFATLLTPGSGALTPSEFRLAVVGAAYYDAGIARRPNTKVLMIPNTAAAMVIQTALGLRISELRMLRWGHIDFARGFVLVTGTKTRRSFRVVPLQEQLVPWLEELRAREYGSASPDPRAFLIRTDPRRGPLHPGAQSTLVNRYARALMHSGMKREKKSTHWARATHATWGAASPLVTTEALKAYLGHQTRYGGSTDAYVHVMLEVMPSEHRRYIGHLPTPDEVRRALAEFTPVKVMSWRERRVWRSRSKAARELRRELADTRKPLRASLSQERPPEGTTAREQPVQPAARGSAGAAFVTRSVAGEGDATSASQRARELLRGRGGRGG